MVDIIVVAWQTKNLMEIVIDTLFSCSENPNYFFDKTFTNFDMAEPVAKGLVMISLTTKLNKLWPVL